MGFYRRKRVRTRPVADEDVVRLDVRSLKRRGVLHSGVQAEVRWWRDLPFGGRELRASAELMVIGQRPDRPSSLVASLAGPEAVGVTQTEVPIEWRPVHLGGERPWLRCPCCDRRVLVLWGEPALSCRTCQHVAYACQNEGPAERALRKAMLLRVPLGLSQLQELSVRDLREDDRPKRMRRRTYDRLRGKALAAEQVWHVRELRRWGALADQILPING